MSNSRKKILNEIQKNINYTDKVTQIKIAKLVKSSQPDAMLQHEIKIDIDFNRLSLELLDEILKIIMSNIYILNKE
jgi:hypothetical protein